MSAVDHFQGDPVRIARRAHDEIQQAEAERVERVCAALRAMPGLTDEAARMFAKTILNHLNEPLEREVPRCAEANHRRASRFRQLFGWSQLT
ncbi:hypothetical protein EAH80_29360 [Mycobacterium hodleri]|uniref:Uncharacterized protein n=1 Tax=Mycolicibacterium hodleri TaxID=49897 RepID=A0A502DNU1_9MYCO|nr:hypothetical protein EAH80_29360 [Mycolicibacterium hodleri]